MIRHESKSALLFRHWVRANPIATSAIETKDTRGKDYLNFSEVGEEQINYGLAIKSNKGVLLRIVPIAKGMPDYVWLRNEPAWIVIKYPSCMVMIDVEDFINERDRCTSNRSLTVEKAQQIATEVIPLNSSN